MCVCVCVFSLHDLFTETTWKGGVQRDKVPRPHTQLLLVVCGSSRPARVNTRAFAVNGLSRMSKKVAKHPPRLSFKGFDLHPILQAPTAVQVRACELVWSPPPWLEEAG